MTDNALSYPQHEETQQSKVSIDSSDESKVGHFWHVAPMTAVVAALVSSIFMIGYGYCGIVGAAVTNTSVKGLDLWLAIIGTGLIGASIYALNLHERRRKAINNAASS